MSSRKHFPFIEFSSPQVKKGPGGYEHVEWDYYHKHYGSIEDNAEDGHYEFYLDGKRGVRIPGPPITKVEIRDVDSAEVSTDIALEEGSHASPQGKYHS